MRPYEFPSFHAAIQQAAIQLQFRSRIVHSDHWQGADIRNRPEMATHEVKNLSWQTCMVPDDLGEQSALDYLREQIGPNLPWADDHFEERVCGFPINPGEQWKKWPYGNSAQKFLDERGMFNHNYMERYWPKYAGSVAGPHETADQFIGMVDVMPGEPQPNRGIMYEYGDLNDVVELLARDPYTRQAYLPVWFPEDTGGGSKRAPCTLGYHFLMRDNRLDIDYHIRSCDFVRHFRDDIYLTVRLALWMLERCASIDSRWESVRPGQFVMHIGSLHMFRNDYMQVFKGARS